MITDASLPMAFQVIRDEVFKLVKKTLDDQPPRAAA